MEPLKKLVFFQFFILITFLFLVIIGMKVTDSQAGGMTIWGIILLITGMIAYAPKI